MYHRLKKLGNIYIVLPSLNLELINNLFFIFMDPKDCIFPLMSLAVLIAPIAPDFQSLDQ